MATNSIQYNQSNFNRGEIDGLISARFDYEDYDKALKRARNCITLPQGAVANRFGTRLVGIYDTISDPTQIDVSSVIVNEDDTYLPVFRSLNIDIFHNNIKIQTNITTTYTSSEITDLRYSQSGNGLVITHSVHPPAQLIQTVFIAGITSANTGTNVMTTNLSGGNVFVVGDIFPFTLTAAVTLPATTPAIALNTQYWGLAISTTTLRIFPTELDASKQTNAYVFTSNTASATIRLTRWTIANMVIVNYPAYDFTSTVGYSGTRYNDGAFTFTWTWGGGAGSGPGSETSQATITASSSIFNQPSSAFYNGGLLTFASAQGLYVFRILSVSGDTTVTGYFTQYPSGTITSPVVANGQQCFLGAPAWSAASGYPRCSTSFQGRLFFGGTPSIPNGVWGSVIGNVYDFDDSESLPDYGISYYPSSGNISYIKSMTSARSLLVHTTTGTFSTALSTEQPLTPTNISFTEQNKDGVSGVQPIFIDNQVIYVDRALNNVKNLIWEFGQASYVLRNISIVSSSLIRKPVDSASYSNPLDIDGSYVLVVNDDGTLATFNTLYMENVGGWTLQNTVQWRSDDGTTILPNNYTHVVSSFERIWFLVQREFYALTSVVAFTGVNLATNSISLSAPVSANANGIWQVVFFSNAPNYLNNGNLDQLDLTPTYYWARQTTTSSFVLYNTWSDADSAINPIILETSTAGTVQLYNPYPVICLEELDFTVSLDCFLSGSVSNGTFTFDTPALNSAFNGQNIYYYGASSETLEADGTFTSTGYSSGPTKILNGSYTNSGVPNTTSAYIGYPFKMEVQFLPINIPLSTGANFYRNKSLRQFYLYYYRSLGFKINGQQIPVTSLFDYPLGSAPPPETGITNYAPMLGWEPLNQTITVTQEEPLPLTILGYSAAVEIT